jgi:hypothetical protein
MENHDHGRAVQLLDSPSTLSNENSTAHDSDGQGEQSSSVAVDPAWIARARRIGADGIMSVCESPMERRLLAAFLDAGFDHMEPAADGFPHCVAIRAWESRAAAFLFAQHPATLEGKDYRFDFVVLTFDTAGNIISIIVEVDGHDFHERTKEQAQRDKSRDRSAQREGWHVLRFTGSEVFRDAARCVDEVLATIATLTAPRAGGPQ